MIVFHAMIYVSKSFYMWRLDEKHDNSKRQFTNIYGRSVPINAKQSLSTSFDDPNRGICIADRTTASNKAFSKPVKRTDPPETDPTARVAIPLQK